MSDDWKFIQRLAGSTSSQAFAMLAFAEADDIYIFKNRRTGKKVKVYAKSMSQAGEKLAKGKYEDYD